MKWKKRGIIAAIILGPILIFIIVEFKLWLRGPSKMDYFFYDVAVDFNAPDICEKIHPWAYRSGAGFGGPPAISYLRSDCYDDLARKTHNPDLCNLITPLSTYFLDGSGYKEICTDRVREGVPGGDSAHVNPDDLLRIIQQFGFSDYSSLKYGPAQNKEKFLEAVRKL